MKTGDAERYPLYFILLYAVTYMTNAVYGTFIPVYLDHVGFNQVTIGTLLAMGPFVAVLAQPLWGLVSDRASSKNGILKVLILGSAMAVLLYPLLNNFYYLFAAIAIFTFFQSSVGPITDAITLEHLEATRWKFGPVRMAGTIGYAVMSIIAGRVARQNISNIFILYSFIAVIAFFAVFRLPKIKGHQSQGNKLSPLILFKNKELVILIAFNFVIQATFGFYYSFFPIYYKHLGADSALLGIAMFITPISEIPFLLFADKILKKLGIKFVLIASAFVISIRWMLLHFITDIHAILAVNATHGLSFIVFAFCMATYINKNVPKELKASGQTMNAVLCMGVARIIGSIFGGYFSDMIGIKQVFMYTSLAAFAAIIAFGAVFLAQRNKKPEIEAQIIVDN